MHSNVCSDDHFCYLTDFDVSLCGCNRVNNLMTIAYLLYGLHESVFIFNACLCSKTSVILYLLDDLFAVFTIRHYSNSKLSPAKSAFPAKSKERIKVMLAVVS